MPLVGRLSRGGGRDKLHDRASLATIAALRRPLETAVTLLPEATYALLDAHGGIRRLPGGDEFWRQPPQALEALGGDWLVTESCGDADWAHWEMHPDGDEFVYLLDGDIEFRLEMPEGLVVQRLSGRGAIIVPRGVWHTARLLRSSRMFFITRGGGTQHRPV